MKPIPKTVWKQLLILLVVLAVFVIGYLYFQANIFNLESEEFYAWLESLGIWAPVFMIGLMTVEVVIAPLPGGWLTIATGYLFGPWLGFLISYIGMSLGSIIAFELARHLGQPFVRRLVKPEQFQAYGEKLHASQWGIFLLYVIPLFPVDIVSLLLGLSGIKRQRFWLLMSLGYLPNTFILNFVGNAIAAPEYQFMIIGLTGTVILYFLVRWLHLRRQAH